LNGTSRSNTLPIGSLALTLTAFRCRRQRELAAVRRANELNGTTPSSRRHVSDVRDERPPEAIGTMLTSPLAATSLSCFERDFVLQHLDHQRWITGPSALARGNTAGHGKDEQRHGQAYPCWKQPRRAHANLLPGAQSANARRARRRRDLPIYD
jgi:hypothetical protein